MTRLVTDAHGTRRATGSRVAAEITRRAGERLGLESQASYVEVCAPLVVDRVVARATRLLVPARMAG